MKELKEPQEYIEKEKAYQIQEIKRRSSLYHNSQDRYELRNNNKKYVILADDGAATGATVIAGAKMDKKNVIIQKVI